LPLSSFSGSGNDYSTIGENVNGYSMKQLSNIIIHIKSKGCRVARYIFVSCCIVFNAVAGNVSENIQQIEQLFSGQQQQSNDEIIALAQQVVSAYRQYDDNTLGKTYLLLAKVAASNNELSKAIQFIEDGLHRSNISWQVKTQLLTSQCDILLRLSQLKALHQCADNLLKTQLLSPQKTIQLLAMSYKALAFALDKKYQLTIQLIKQMTPILAEEHQAIGNINLLLNLALTHDLLGSYQVALSYYTQLLALKFEHDHTQDIAHTYYGIAREYRQLNKLDDAFNAYWEGRRIAEKQQQLVMMAMGDLGLADLDIAQQRYQPAYDKLIKVEKILRYETEQFPNPYRLTLMLLAKAAFGVNKPLVAYQLLSQVEAMIDSKNLPREQIELLLLLAKKQQYQGNDGKALEYVFQYVEQMSAYYQSDQLVHQAAIDAIEVAKENNFITQNSMIQNQLNQQLKQLKQSYRYLQVAFLIVVVVMTLGLLVCWQRNRELKLTFDLIDTERPDYYLPNSRLTQKEYQKAFMQARKYHYPLTVVYLTISNWADLTQSFRRKVVIDVSKTIATLINEHITDFDFAGRLADGEFLLYFPHQQPTEVNAILVRLNAALKAQLFANLGAFSVMIDYQLAMPETQDIDPFIFLSKLQQKSTKDTV
jgi:GGDEF domain-containing protein